MSRRTHWLLIAGCCVIGVLEFPAAVRSVGETWRGPYALDPSALAAPSDPAVSEVSDAVASPSGMRRTQSPGT